MEGKGTEDMNDIMIMLTNTLLYLGWDTLIINWYIVIKTTIRGTESILLIFYLKKLFWMAGPSWSPVTAKKCWTNFEIM